MSLLLINDTAGTMLLLLIFSYPTPV